MIILKKEVVIRAQDVSDPFTKEPLIHSHSPLDSPKIVVLHIVSYLPSQTTLAQDSPVIEPTLETIDTEAGSLTVRRVDITGSYDLNLGQPTTFDLYEFWIEYDVEDGQKAQAIFVKEDIHEYIEDHDPETKRGTVTTPKII